MQANKKKTQELQSIHEDHQKALDEEARRTKAAEETLQNLQKEMESANRAKDELSSRAKMVRLTESLHYETKANHDLNCRLRRPQARLSEQKKTHNPNWMISLSCLATWKKKLPSTRYVYPGDLTSVLSLLMPGIQSRIREMGGTVSDEDEDDNDSDEDDDAVD